MYANLSGELPSLPIEAMPAAAAARFSVLFWVKASWTMREVFRQHDKFPSQSINQSKILTEPHTGKEKSIPALPQGAANPASRSDTGLGG